VGFALGAMPVGLGTMRRLEESLGPAPRAFLVITLAASLFADAANAIGIGTMFHLLN
jgi:ESS family glutamate:Na+ symporter